MDIVSVIIPCYNASSFVDKFSWIFEQTYPELEVVLVDDCSTDDTWQKLQEFKKQNASKRLIIAHNEQNLGAGETRNYGLSLSSGKYVCFWDADDRAYPQFVEKMLAKLQQEQADFVCCAHNTLDSQDILKHYPISKNLLSRSKNPEELKQLVFTFEAMPWLKLVRRDFIEERGIYFPKMLLSEDRCWTTLLVINANKIAFVDEPLYQYYTGNPSSIMHTLDEGAIDSVLDVIQFVFEYIQKLESDSKQALYELWRCWALECFLFFYDSMADKWQKKFSLEMRDYCQQHQIDLTGKSFPAYYKFRLYRFLPNIAFFAPLREQMKRAYYKWQTLYPLMQKTLALIKKAESREGRAS